MNKKLKVTLSSLLVGVMLTACAVTLKQTALHLKRDWLELREQVIVAYSEGKLDDVVVLDYILTDEDFQEKYAALVDKILADGDVSEDEIRYLQSLIDSWKDRIP